jgi:predicted aspartyl protease
VPIFYDGITLRIPVHLFGKTLYFIVDTGSTISGVDVRYISDLGEPIENAKASTMNVAGPQLTIYPCPDCHVADIPVRLDKIAAMDLSGINTISGSPCDGVLGMDFLRQHVFSIDLDKKTLTVANPAPEGVRDRVVVISLSPFRGRHYAVQAKVNHVPVEFMIDTGDSGSMSLNAADWRRVFPSGSAKVHTILEGGVSSEPVRIAAARIDSMELASNHYQNLVATLANNPAAPSTLGLKFLRRHIVTFDFVDQTLILRPSLLFTELESADMSGLHIIRQGIDTVIYAVDEGSPAAQVKLAAGDVIESINGKDARSFTLRDIRRALKARDQEKVIIRIRRGDEEGTYELVLRNSL